ncbi:zinc finger protein 771-like isoform X1 [Conger conger]|nr:zinc finger protein 771-like isoform X1 [Conger conger]XP_061093979.1 zinc finger protein 771-like isoform X1 [Conger conger]
MESICVTRGTLETLMVTVKQEEEEVESLSDSLLCVKKEEGEDACLKEPLGHSPLYSAQKEDPDAPGGERERKKVKKKKRRREAKAWASMGAEGGSGGDLLWRCGLCQRCFSSSWELTGHCCPGVTGARGGPDRDVAKLEFWCPVCGDRFLRPTAFILHKRSHVGQSRYVCGVCGRTLKTLRQLAAHRRSHTRGPFLPHLCQDCSCSFRSLKALRRHRAREHGEERGAVDEGTKQEEGDCCVPMLSCSSPNDLPELSQNPQCTLCFMTFRDAETAERHLRFKHPAEYERQLRGRTVFACCACDRTFPSSRLLSAHQRTHSKWSLSSLGSEGALQDRRRDGGVQEGQSDGKTKRLACGKFDKGGAGSMRCCHCHIIFADPRTWGRHMTAKHPPPPTSVQATPGCFSLRPPRGQPRPYSCSTCGEKFIEESSLTKHHTESHAS